MKFSNIVEGIKEGSYLYRGRKWMCLKDYPRAIEYFEHVDPDSPNYRLVMGMMAFCHVNLGQEKQARYFMKRLTDDNREDDNYLAYVDHLDAALIGDMKLLKDSSERFRSIRSRYIKMTLKLFIPRIRPPNENMCTSSLKH